MRQQKTTPRYFAEDAPPGKGERDMRRYITVRFSQGWVVWDRKHGRVADGVYMELAIAHEQTDAANEDPDHYDRDWFGGSYWRTEGKQERSGKTSKL